MYLLDFGASRDYSKPFVDDYLRVIHSAVIGDRQGVVDASKALGYLTGYESKVCLYRGEVGHVTNTVWFVL